MAALELEAKLAILDQAMKRLEGELQLDEHWRALVQPAPESEAGTAAMEARNTRLRLALESNPVYRAWKDVRDVTDMLRAKTREAALPPAPQAAQEAPAADPGSDRLDLSDILEGEPAHQGTQNAAEPAAPVPGAAPEDLAAHYELPVELADLIRLELEMAEQELAEQESREDSRAIGARATRAVDRLLEIPSVEPVSAEQLDEARRRAASFTDRKPRPGLSERLAEARKTEDDDATHSVPLAAEDLAFLLSPSTAPTKASVIKAAPPQAPAPRTPFLKRLTAEEQVPRPLTEGPVGEAEVTVVRRGAQKGASPETQAEEPSGDGDGAGGEKAARLSQLLKAWNRQ